MLHFTIFGWITITIAALFVGISKTALPGLSTLAVAMFAAVMPAKLSTAVILLLLMVGDFIAVWTYRHDADWPTLRKLVPTVVVGVAAGAVFLRFADDLVMRRSIGWILLGLTALTLLGMYRRDKAAPTCENPATGTSPSEIKTQPGRALAARTFYGVLGGFTTMAANAGGPVMSLYFLWARFPMMKFLGTTAWFFFIINLTKLPFSAAIGLVHIATVTTDALLAPLVIVGALLGRYLIARMNQRLFNPLIIVLTIGSCLYLVR